MKIRLHIGTSTIFENNKSMVEFDGVKRGERRIGVSDKEVLYKTSDGRFIVYTRMWEGSVTTRKLHLVTKKDLVVGGKFEALGRELGFCKPLTLDEALGIKKEPIPDLLWGIWYVRHHRFLLHTHVLDDFKNKPDRLIKDRRIEHPVFFSKEKAELCLAEWVQYVQSDLTGQPADKYVVMPYWEKWYSVWCGENIIIGSPINDEKLGFAADAYIGCTPLFKTFESADRYLDKVDEHYAFSWRTKRHTVKRYTL